MDAMSESLYKLVPEGRVIQPFYVDRGHYRVASCPCGFADHTLARGTQRLGVPSCHSYCTGGVLAIVRSACPFVVVYLAPSCW